MSPLSDRKVPIVKRAVYLIINGYELFLLKLKKTLFFFSVLQKDKMFSIVPELSEPCCSVLAHSVDCRNKPLPPYAGNLVFMLPVKHEMPCHYAVRIKLCKGVDPRDWQGILLRKQIHIYKSVVMNLRRTDQYVVKLSNEPAFLLKWHGAIRAVASVYRGKNLVPCEKNDVPDCWAVG